jgi:hypothetical protein
MYIADILQIIYESIGRSPTPCRRHSLFPIATLKLSFVAFLFLFSAFGSCLPLDDSKMKEYSDTNLHMIFDNSDPKSCWHISKAQEFANCQRFNISSYFLKKFRQVPHPPVPGDLLEKERLFWDRYLCHHVDEIYSYFDDKREERYASVIYQDLFSERKSVMDHLSHALTDISYLKILAFQGPDIYLESKSMREREKENAQDYVRRKATGVLMPTTESKNYENIYETAKKNFEQSSPSRIQTGEYSSFLMVSRENVYESFKALLKSFRYSPFLVETFTRGQQAWDKYVLNHYRVLKAITKGDPQHETLVEGRTFLLMMDRKNFLDSWRQYYTTYRKRSDAGWGRGSKEIEEICTSPRPRFLPKFEKLC